jgi:hypothetical protein
VAAIALAAAQTTWQQVDQLDRTRPPNGFWVPAQPSPFEQQVGSLAWRGFAGAIAGLFTGIVVGATRPRPLLGVLLAVPIGVFSGALAASFFTEPENVFLVVVGSVLLLLLGVVVRVFSRRPQ